MTIKLTDARANVHLDLTMSTEADIDALIAAVRAETLREVRKVTQGLRDALGKEGDYPLPIRAYELRDMLAALDALEHTERDQAYNTGLSDLIAARIIDQLHLAGK